MSNNQEEIILSICVPTYKLPDGIRRLFQNLAGQETAGIEILIRDDSPDDLTEKIVKDFIARNSINIRYFKGEKAPIGGYDSAFLFLIRQARGRFLFWFGDDVLVPGALARMLAVLRSNPDLLLLWVNSGSINDPSEVGVKLPADRYFDDPNDLLEIDVGLLFFSAVINREKSLNGLVGAEKFIGTAVAGFYLVLYVMAQPGRSFFMRDPVFLCAAKPAGEKRWYDSFEVHAFNYYRVGLALKNKFRRSSFRRAFGDQFGQIWRAVLVERAKGFTTGFGAKTPKIRKVIRHYWSFPEAWLAIVLFLVPRPVLRILYRFYKYFFPKTRGRGRLLKIWK